MCYKGGREGYQEGLLAERTHGHALVVAGGGACRLGAHSRQARSRQETLRECMGGPQLTTPFPTRPCCPQMGRK